MFDKISEQFQFDKISEQFQSLQKPVSQLAAVNAKALEQLTQQQADLVSRLLNDGVAYAEGVSGIKDVTAAVQYQKAYSEGVQEKLVANAKDAYAVMVETQEKAGEVLKDVFAQAKEAAQAVPVAPKAAKPRAKAAATAK